MGHLVEREAELILQAAGSGAARLSDRCRAPVVARLALEVVPRRSTLLGAIATDPVDRRVVDTGGEEGLKTIRIANGRRAFEPALHETGHHVLGDTWIHVAAGKRDHLRSMPFIQARDRR